eukprot:NODE_5421_length_707_cov_64.884498_g4568_i0.p2 GENE.NODE_5421_length_707_cov_64.884498_g4568_i0~~NODE_5421_length_707_cov_64.884498_g4568_i0.p2  ORF type:complete len:191 (+),score=64.88 NODE_5421_length_707_cov_64.884498_g4568_i0:83-655(+)
MGRLQLHNKRTTKENRRWLHHFELIGRKKPSAKEPIPQVFKFEVFAPDRVTATSRFWYYMNRQRKIKKSTGGEILKLRELEGENEKKIRNYAIFIRARSTHGITNLTKEVRATSRLSAVQQMYHDMAARHRVRYYDIQIINVAVRKNSSVKRESIKQFLDPNIKFPLLHRIRRRLFSKKLYHFRPPTTFA